jgi:hypothetical protein
MRGGLPAFLVLCFVASYAAMGGVVLLTFNMWPLDQEEAESGEPIGDIKPDLRNPSPFAYTGSGPMMHTVQQHWRRGTGVRLQKLGTGHRSASRPAGTGRHRALR